MPLKISSLCVFAVGPERDWTKQPDSAERQRDPE